MGTNGCMHARTDGSIFPQYSGISSHSKGACILAKQLKEWRENEAMIQKKKMQKKMEDDNSGEGDASVDGMATLEGKFEVGTSKMQSDSGALPARFLRKNGKDITSQSYGKTMMPKRMAVRMDHQGWAEEERRSMPTRRYR
jgi:hypothetical protein